MNSIYIGGGFLKSQLLYVLPVIHGYASRTEVSKLVFDSESFNAVSELANEVIINKLIEGYKLLEAPRPNGSKPFDFIINLIHGIKKFGVIDSLCIFTIHSTNLLRDAPWTNLQVRHAAWDSICLTLEDGSLNISIVKRLKAIISILAHYGYGDRISSRYNVDYGFFAHGVYQSRAVIAAFRNRHAYCFVDALKCIYRLPLSFDISHSTFAASYWYEYLQKIDINKVQPYWIDRLEGNSRYADAALAAQGEQHLKDDNYGVLFLHIFKDSPFLNIDTDRIFPDYIEWVKFSLSCILRTQDKWIIRMHPSHELWGEDQVKWISVLLKSCGVHSLPQNISLVDSSVSVNSLLKGAYKIITYHGTVHLEAACHGIKPIIISNCSLHDFDKGAVYKPLTMEDYASLILCSDRQKFILDIHYRERAKLILYIRENLLGFGNCINSITLYRNDDPSMALRDYVQVLRSLEACIDSLKEAGSSLCRLNHTLSLDQYSP